MMATRRPEPSEESSVLTNGFVDLMTSLAVIFILLFAFYIARVEDGNANANSSRATLTEIEAKWDAHTSISKAEGPGVLTVTVPEAALEFEFGKSALLPSSESFLSGAMPHYASMICGPGGQDVEAFVIEGYTDDLGDDVHNLRLSQDRSFAVLVKSLEVIRARLPWAYECFLQKAMANGRGRQNLLRNETGHPNREKSRRVMFKIHKRPM
jgi:outer membrane protein OmpA-like peptidoglycan-associated protein